MACGWQGYVCGDFCGDLDKEAVCDVQKIDKYISEFVNFV